MKAVIYMYSLYEHGCIILFDTVIIFVFLFLINMLFFHEKEKRFHSIVECV